MPLNAREFRKRSEEFFPATYLTSIGVIQSVAMGMLAVKTLDARLTWLMAMQALGSFVAIFLIATEYLWWLLLVRRTPRHRDVAVPYVLGIFEFLAVARIDDTEGKWFFLMTLLSITSIWALLVAREDFENSEEFRECPWVPALAIRNVHVGIGLVAGMGAVCLLAGLDLYFSVSKHPTWVLFLSMFYLLGGAMLRFSSRFLQDVRERFQRELKKPRRS